MLHRLWQAVTAAVRFNNCSKVFKVFKVKLIINGLSASPPHLKGTMKEQCLKLGQKGWQAVQGGPTVAQACIALLGLGHWWVKLPMG